MLVAPPSDTWHGETAYVAGWVVGSFVRQHQLGRIYAAETGSRIGRNPDTVRAPDFAFLSAAKVPEGPRVPGYLDFAPDFIIEVVSTHDTAIEVQPKMEQWLAAGVELGWALYPLLERVAVYRPGQPILMLGPDDVLDGGEVLPGFQCRVRDLFPH